MNSFSRALAPQFWPLACTVAAFIVLMAEIGGMATHGGLFAEDDAYYYLVIARNIAHSGVSTFDQQSLTNGYHPLWLAVLVFQRLVFGPSLFVTFVIEAMLVAAGLYLFLRQSPVNHGLFHVAFAAIFLALFNHLILTGMEVSLLVFCVGLFVRALGQPDRDRPRSGWLLGLAAAACIGARIDAAFFIVPALLAAPASRRNRMIGLAVLAALGAIYASYNWAMFGAALPVSSTIKSLGGVQINHPLLMQMSRAWSRSYFRSPYMFTLAALLASPLIIVLSKRDTVARTLATSASVGGVVFLAKLILLSSWVVWSWYNFAVLFPLLASYYALAPLAAGQIELWSVRMANPRLARTAITVAAAAGLLTLLGMALAALQRPFRHEVGYAQINRMAVARYGPVLAGARVAMGDRAGSFAMEYPGPVVQLEGLVNDKAYLRAVRHGDDVTPLLCARGVSYLVAYEADLGAYRRHQVRLFRPILTQFPGPTVTVDQKDEIGSVSDLAIWNGRNDYVDDNRLYIWRLGGCPRS